MILMVNLAEVTAQRIVYGYDNAGNRTSREQELPDGRQAALEEEDSILTDLLEAVTDEIVIYPNAFDRYLYIRTSDKEYPLRLNIFDLQGRLFYHGRIDQDGVAQFDLGHLAVGLYMVRMTGRSEEFLYRILKNK